MYHLLRILKFSGFSSGIIIAFKKAKNKGWEGKIWYQASWWASNFNREEITKLTGRKLADRFREHLRDVKKDNKDDSKPVARHFNLPNHSTHNMTMRGLSLHKGNRKNASFNSALFIITESMNAGFSFNSFICMFNSSLFHRWHSSSILYKNTLNTQFFPIRSDALRAKAQNVSFAISSRLQFDPYPPVFSFLSKRQLFWLILFWNTILCIPYNIFLKTIEFKMAAVSESIRLQII